MNQIVLVGTIKKLITYNNSLLIAYKDAGDSKADNEICVYYKQETYDHILELCKPGDLIGIKGYISGQRYETHIVGTAATILKGGD